MPTRSWKKWSRIKKVLLVCDKTYVEKADGRSGGVGTETQIITGEIYASQAQDKFVAIVTERDNQGKAYLPAYYRSRIYIDLSDPGTSLESFEQILRWAFDQPLHKKPELGEKPKFLSTDVPETNTSGISFSQRRAIDAIRNHRPFAVPATAEFLESLSAVLEKFRLDPQSEPFDEAVILSIGDFLKYRDEAIGVFLAIAANFDTIETRRLLHGFFERLMPYLEMPDGVTTFRDWDWDNFKFIVHELFLYAIASLIRYERFEAAAYLAGTRYYVPRNNIEGKDVMAHFGTFRRYMKSLDFRNKRLQLNRLSLRADLLKERCNASEFNFRQLMQADFILFIRGELQLKAAYSGWFPETLLYAHSGMFEVFARSRSKSYFDRLKTLLGVSGKEELAAVLSQLAQDTNRVPRWQFESFNSSHLIGFEKLATEP